MATIIQIANADANLVYFSKGLKLSGLEEKLNGAGPFTFLAPVNFAFTKIDSLSREDLFLPANRVKLIDLLSSHILVGKVMLTDLGHNKKLKTIGGQEVMASISNGSTHVNGARILAKDRQAQNGVVHSVDAVYSVS